MGFDEDFKDENPIKDLLSVGIYWLFVVLTITIGFYSLTAGEALTDPKLLTRFVVYSIPLLAYGVFITVVKVAHKFDYLKWLHAFVHDVEYGLFGRFKIISNPLLLVQLSIILFGSIAFIATITNATQLGQTMGNFIYPFTPGFVEEQATPSSRVLFSIYGSPSENGWLWIILGFLVSIELLFAHLVGFSKRVTYWVMVIPNSGIAAIVWREIHVLVTGTDEIIQLSHFVFGFRISLLTQITGSIIPGEIDHLFNNLFYSIIRFFGNEVMVVLFGLLLIGAVIGLVATYLGMKKR